MTTTKTMNVTKMDVSRVAKQLKQIKTTAQTTVVGILLDKQHERLCNADGMSKNMAIACIEESLTSVGKNAQPSLDFKSHKLEDKALGRVSLSWVTPQEAATGLHRVLAKELERECYGDLHHGSSPKDHNSHEVEIHSMGENLTAADVKQLFVVSDPPQSLHDSGGGIENNDTDADDNDRSDTDDDDQEELEEDEYEEDFEPSAGRTSHDGDKTLMAYALQLIKQRERLILLTIQAKQGQSEQLQQNKKTATKSLMKCERRQEKYEEQLELLEARLDPAEGEQTSNDEDEESVPTARSTRSSVRTLKNKLNETATQMTTSELQVQAAQDALKITTRDMGLMKNKLLDNQSIEASLIEHAAKLHRWHLQPKIERSTVLKAVNEYTKEKNYVPFDEFEKMTKVQRTLLWHAAQATLYNLLVKFATADFKYIYNKRKAKAKAADISSTSDTRQPGQDRPGHLLRRANHYSRRRWNWRWSSGRCCCGRDESSFATWRGGRT